MNWASFASSLTNNLRDDGTLNKIKTYLQQNTMGGKLYDPYSDPEFMQKLQNARTLGTPAARQNLVQEYRQYVNTGDTGMSAEEYLFNPAEGTSQYYEKQLDKLNYDDALVKSGYLPEQIAMEKALNEANLEKAQTYNEYYDTLLQNQVESGNISNNAAEFNLDKAMKFEPLEYRQIEQGIEQNNIAIDTGRENIDFMREINPLKIAGAELGLQNDQLTYDKDLFGFQQEQELAPINKSIQEENLYQLRTKNKYLEQQMQNEMTAQELQIYNRELANTLNELQIKQNRQLYPIEVEAVKQNLLNSKLQNKGIGLTNTGRELNNIGQGLNNELTQIKIDEYNKPSSVAEDTSLSSLMESLGFDMGDYRGQTNDGQIVFQSGEGGRIAVNPQSGQWQDYTGQQVAGESLGGNVIYELPDGEVLRQNQAGLAVYDDGTPYVDESGQMYTFTNFEGYIQLQKLNPDFGINNQPVVDEPDEGPGFWGSIRNSIGGNNQGKTQQTGTNNIPNTFHSNNRNQYKNNNAEAKYTIGQTINNFKKSNPNLSNVELADRIEQRYTDEEFLKETGLSKYQVIGLLRSKR